MASKNAASSHGSKSQASKPQTKAKAPVKGAQGSKKAAPSVGGKLAALKKMIMGGGGGASGTGKSNKNKKRVLAPEGIARKKAGGAGPSAPATKSTARTSPAPSIAGGGAAVGGSVAVLPGRGAATGAKQRGGGKKASAAPLVTSLSQLTRGGKPAAPVTAVSGDAVCREVACEGLATTSGYCRLHYLKNWKKIKRKELILKERKLNQYIEELVVKYPDKYIEAIRQDLESDKDFAKVIVDLDLDEGVDEFVEGESETDEAIIDNIKRDFDDSDSEGF